MMVDDVDEELQIALKSIVDQFEKDDQEVRYRQIRLWKKLNYYWNGITNIWWSEQAHDWRIWNEADDQERKQINVFRAYLESIIAALSVTVPMIKCKPDDADNINDVLTAKGGTKIAELIYDHIDAPLLWCKALFIYCTQGMVAAYNYTDENEKYGTVDVAKYEDVEQDVTSQSCPNCGTELLSMNDDEYDPSNSFSPDSNSNSNSNLANTGSEITCPECGQQVIPQQQTNKVIVTRLTGVTKQPKSRQIIKVEGGLYVKVPNYARSQADIPYLAYCYETHYSNIYERYPHLRGKLDESSSNGNDYYERWGRLSSQYHTDEPINTPTVRNWWLRPSSFELINDDETRKKLVKKFKNGTKCVWVNETFAEAKDEALDDHWTITYNPLSEYVHFDPLGKLLVSIQEVTDELTNLILQTIEHGIPQTFADPSVLNFTAYGNMETTPGMIYPARAKGGKSLAEGFYTISTATLSQEIEPFANKIQEMAQFVSGALPSLFGGAQASSSRTAAQYSMSRNQALQRLQTSWKMINYWWKNTFAKVIPAYIKNMLEDERLVKEQHNSFINVMIRKSELDGKIGAITLAGADEIPHSWGQVKDTVMQLIQTNNPQILDAIGSPSNLQVLSDAIGLTDFILPGEDDREKQLEEIQLLLQSAPIEGPPDQAGQPQEQPSIMPELNVDNHKIEADITREWLVSEIGRQTKISNEDGYKNVLLHLSAHIQMLQQLSQPPQAAPGPMAKPQLKPIQGGRNG